MFARSLIRLVSGVSAFALAGCSDRRPEPAVAQADFSRRYPQAEVVNISITMDEVVARSFAITYRLPGASQEQTLDIHYVENARGDYEIVSPPAQLP